MNHLVSLGIKAEIRVCKCVSPWYKQIVVRISNWIDVMYWCLHWPCKF